MKAIHFGSDTEYVKIELPDSYLLKGWADADVEISVSCFRGKIIAWLEASDIEIFTLKLRRLYDSLQGEAELVPREKQFTLKLVGATGGHIRMTGVAWSKATYENKLEFDLEIDQSYLQGPLKILESLPPEVSRQNA